MKTAGTPTFPVCFFLILNDKREKSKLEAQWTAAIQVTIPLETIYIAYIAHVKMDFKPLKLSM